ncbi:MAG TPA: AAA family ATPase [Herpetosiphonaceae bacterium]
MSIASGYTMPTISGYSISEQIHVGAASLVYRATRNSDGKPVILKLLNNEYPSPAELVKFRRQYDIVKDLKLPGVVQVYALEHCNNTLALIMEDFGGSSLKHAGGTSSFDITSFLNIGIQLADILGAIHQKGIIHKDIKPQNIIINPKTGQVKLTDFAISSLLSQESQQPMTIRNLEGSLPYMSPEQTGRMNRAIDYRSDCYSLGITFYEMLTGDLPFQASDPMELVHAHIARMPVPPHEAKPAIPRAISDIVMKLLAKTAEDRYQNAYGLKADLQYCLDQWTSTGRIDPFPLGVHDTSGLFHIPQKLYGRESETQVLLSAFEMVSTGVTEVVLVAGPSGVGKSVLVYEIQKPVAQQRGYFLVGRYDQHKRNVPYSGFIQAFQDLIRHILSESAERIADWNAQLVNALGANGQVIIDVIPDVELIIGQQAPVPQLGLTEAENRFNLVMQHFIRVFATDEHPLVLFLDDLQWADLASLKLLQVLAADPQTQNLLIVGSYRDNEMSPSHPLMLTLDDLRKTTATVKAVTLRALERKDVNALVSETLHSTPEQTEPLADLVFDKTAGNPFFVNQFLKSLHDDGLIVFDNAHGEWTWDLDQINERSMTDNVLTFMAEKIQKYEPATQRILIQAACIGHQFEMELLSVVSGESAAAVAAKLWPALREGLIIPIDIEYTFAQPENSDTTSTTTSTNSYINIAYRFLHDRVWQAAYSLMNEDDKQQLHLTVGRLLMETTPPERLEERAFDIVNHLNYGIEFITDEAERIKLAWMNLMAGRKAKASTAYPAAREYLSIGMACLPENAWDEHYELALDFYKQRSECEYLTGNFDTAEEYFAVILERAQSNLEKVDVYITHMLLYTNLANFAQATALGREGLRKLFGLDFPEDEAVLQEEVGKALGEIQAQLGGRAIEELVDMPRLTNPERLAEMKYLTTLIPPAYNTSPSLMALIVLRMVMVSLTEGHAPESSFAFSSYGILCAAAFGQYQSAYSYGKLALQLNEIFKAVELQGKVYHVAGFFLSHWSDHIRNSLEYLKQAYLHSLEVGDFVYAGLACWARTEYRLMAGGELNDLFGEIEHYIAFARQSKNPGLLATANLTQNMIRTLRGENPARDSLDNDTFNEQEFVAQMEGQGFLLINHLYYLYKLMLFNMYGDNQRAREMALKAEETLYTNAGTYFIPEVGFWSALALTGLYPTASAEEQAAYKATLEEQVAKFKAWSEYSPANHLCKYYLLSAEMARLNGEHLTAMEMYDRAVNSSREQGFNHYEAIANELAARFFLSRSQEKIARIYLADARHAYVVWGATAKVQQLEEMYQALFPAAPMPSRSHDTTTVKGSTTSHRYTTTTEQNGWLDVVTVLKAAQAISETIVFETLLHTLMHIMLENAGAQSGVLLIERDSALIVAAESRMEQEAITKLPHIPLSTARNLAASVVYYVSRTKEAVVLHDATHEGRFTRDSYIMRKQPKSILCMPLVNQGKLVGILYLENNLTTGAFTPERLEVLRILSSQAAVSLENALLYEQLEAYNRTLEDKVVQRTAELQHMNQELVAARNAAEEASKHKSRFLNTISHELRTPLNAIITMTDLLGAERNGTLTEQQLFLRERVLSNSRHLLDLINDMLDLAKIEAGKMELSREQVQIEEIVQQAMETAAGLTREKPIELRAEISPNLPMVEIDRLRIKQVLLNLLSNAAKFTDEGYILVQAILEGTQVVVRVKDTGIGIDHEHLPVIFEEFRQVDTGTSRRAQGTGLGLPICRRLIEMHGGQLWASSAQGVGSTFSFSLPITQDVDQEEVVSAEAV